MANLVDEEALTEISDTERQLRAMRATVRAQLGPYATEKKFSPCPKCGDQFGVRELRRHLKAGCSGRARKRA
jgi:hypothetical protein